MNPNSSPIEETAKAADLKVKYGQSIAVVPIASSSILSGLAPLYDFGANPADTTISCHNAIMISSSAPGADLRWNSKDLHNATLGARLGAGGPLSTVASRHWDSCAQERSDWNEMQRIEAIAVAEMEEESDASDEPPESDSDDDCGST